jgi:hypothetical protein
MVWPLTCKYSWLKVGIGTELRVGYGVALEFVSKVGLRLRLVRVWEWFLDGTKLRVVYAAFPRVCCELRSCCKKFADSFAALEVEFTS